RRRQAARIVVAHARQGAAIGRQRVPLLAGDLAGLAADAQRRVGEEAVTPARLDPRAGGGLRLACADVRSDDGIRSFLVPIAHRTASPRSRPLRSAQVSALFSCMQVFASPTTAVSTLAMSPLA